MCGHFSGHQQPERVLTPTLRVYPTGTMCCAIPRAKGSFIDRESTGEGFQNCKNGASFCPKISWLAAYSRGVTSPTKGWKKAGRLGADGEARRTRAGDRNPAVLLRSRWQAGGENKTCRRNRSAGFVSRGGKAGYSRHSNVKRQSLNHIIPGLPGPGG